MTTTDYEFTFVDEPPAQRHGRNGIYDAFRQALKARPGEWAIYPKEFATTSSATATVANLKRGNSSKYPRGEYEARSSQKVVYVRYTGGGT